MMDIESVTIQVMKHFHEGTPTHWSAEVSGLDQGIIGIVTGPTFYGVWDSALGFITGDDGEFDSEHNEWVDFNSNSGI